MAPHLRIARPVSDVARAVDMYCQGLGYIVLGTFEDHEGFDGAMVGAPGGAYHFEFTHCRTRPVTPTPTVEDLVVLYLPEADEWESSSRR
ncbi:MAG: VOC family protein, partial [Burkholderiaceae bacterium]